VEPRVKRAVAFVDGQSQWKAASCLRTICAALDAPLPPQLLEEPGAAAAPGREARGRAAGGQVDPGP